MVFSEQLIGSYRLAESVLLTSAFIKFLLLNHQLDHSSVLVEDSSVLDTLGIYQLVEFVVFKLLLLDFLMLSQQSEHSEFIS